jgi:hypothetical protein
LQNGKMSPRARRHTVTETAPQRKAMLGRPGREPAPCGRRRRLAPNLQYNPHANPPGKGRTKGRPDAVWGRIPRGCVLLLGVLGAIRFLSSAGAVRCRPKGSNPAGPLALLHAREGKDPAAGRQFCARKPLRKTANAAGYARG